MLKFGYGAQFSSNSDFIAFKIKPSTDTIRKAKLKKLKKDKMPKDSVGIYSFSNQKLDKFPKVKSVKLSEENRLSIAI